MATTTDVEGNYKLVLPVGAYNLRATLLGYTPLILHNINVTSGNAQLMNFELESADTELNEVTVTYDKGKSAVATDMITPLSVQQLTTEEIKANPGGKIIASANPYPITSTTDADVYGMAGLPHVLISAALS